MAGYTSTLLSTAFFVLTVPSFIESARPPFNYNKLDLVIEPVGVPDPTKGISLNVQEGEPIILKCRGKGNASVDFLKWEISWDENMTQPDLKEEDSRVNVNLTMEESRLVSILTIKSSAFKDRAYYYCHGGNQNNKAKASIIVRVKDKLAALYPALGILGEVLILTTIIIIYEKKRVKLEMEDVLGDGSGSNPDPGATATQQGQRM